ncbi:MULTISPECIES: nitrate- and nitrite sensing domain-containing protein [Nocardia]|uniref:histidine kinase n=1 Tax=Nocardia vinacea TaxID=96468 RepID=A0ABZ1YLI1_9NOCA|nr:nitrate- and nitrite sensing domain-containing protein [Nocardia vinacea]
MTDAERGIGPPAESVPFTARWGIRTRILLIALIPSLTLMSIGGGAATFLVRHGQQAQNFAEILGDSMANNQAMASAVEQERLLTVWQLAVADPDPVGLVTARQHLDDALRALGSNMPALQSTGANELQQQLSDFNMLRSQLLSIRDKVDSSTMPISDVYTFYTAMLSGFDRSGTALIENNAPTVSAAVEMANSLQMLRAVEAMSRSSALTAAVLNETALLPPSLTTELRNLVGFYHTYFEQMANQSTDVGLQAKAIIDTPDWHRLSTMEDAIIHPVRTKTATTSPSPLNAREWRDAATEVNKRLMELWGSHVAQSLDRAAQTASRDAKNSAIAGGGVFGLAIAAFLVALWLANRLIGRLRRLRVETLALTQVRLPETMSRLATGADLDADTEAARLDFGRDELGSVATAFNHAHTAAVGAAITAARTQAGVRAVFLNIAHRSQMVVHRQLELLDAAESRQEDPALLKVFFQLDHLATRERRNAEKLIVLAGGQPVRQWRRPVPLIDVVRSAIGETVDYTRVHTGRLPQILLIGDVVADLTHLLAELLDNATTFSPPQSHVRVTGNPAGKGVILEITDQGIGMAADELEWANGMLRTPPDFSVTSLSESSRLGLFVVAQLGARHNISTKLSESDYGGIRAIVLIPLALVATDLSIANPDHLSDRVTSYRPEPTTTGEVPVTDITAAPLPIAPTSLLGHAPTKYPHHHATESIAPGSTDPRPALPRRRRQASLTPELAQHRSPEPEAAPHHARSAESARDLMSAIEIGTKRGRQATQDHNPTGTNPAIVTSDEQEGEGDLFQHR